MNIQMIGIDHNRASVDARAVFSFTTKAAAEAMQRFRENPHIAGCIILSTCNRMEVWVNIIDDDYQAPLLPLLCEIKGQDPEENKNYFVLRRNEEAIEHLFRMTSGLKSLILGEDQILTQVKTALDMSREAQCTDSVLETLFRMAITGAKKVKGGMQKSMTNVSAIEQAVRWLKEERKIDFEGKSCLVIGNGEMGKRAALAFLGEKCDVTVTVREYRSGVVQIPQGCKRINYSQRYIKMPECDFVVSATSSPNRTVLYEEVSRLDGTEGQIFIDLAVPRDIDTRIRELEGVELYDIDDFHVKQSRENERAIAQAQDVLTDQIREFFDWYNGRDIVPRIKEVGEELSNEVYWRMGRTVKKLALPDEEQLMLEDAVKTAASKEIQKLLFKIRSAAGADVIRRCLDVLYEDKNE